MERNELIRRMVLHEIVDDYENVDQIIFPSVSKKSEKCGFTVSRSDVVDALASLVADGFAKAYRLDSLVPPRQFDGMPSLDVIETDFETYFIRTKAGLEYHKSDNSWWPLHSE